MDSLGPLKYSSQELANCHVGLQQRKYTIPNQEQQLTVINTEHTVTNQSCSKLKSFVSLMRRDVITSNNPLRYCALGRQQ